MRYRKGICQIQDPYITPSHYRSVPMTSWWVLVPPEPMQHWIVATSAILVCSMHYAQFRIWTLHCFWIWIMNHLRRVHYNSCHVSHLGWQCPMNYFLALLLFSCIENFVTTANSFCAFSCIENIVILATTIQLSLPFLSLD